MLLVQNIGASLDIYCYYATSYEGFIGRVNYRYQYKCLAVVDNIDDGSWEIDFVYGNHEVNKTSDSVTFFEVQDENLQYIPSNLAFFFPNLTGITIVNSKLQRLVSDDLRPFFNLNLLRVSKNPITELFADSFRYNSKLLVIDMSSNKIRGVGKNLLLTLSKLVSVYFTKNECVDEYAEDPLRILRLNVKLSKICPIINI